MNGSGLAETLTLARVVLQVALAETVLFVKMEKKKKNLLTTDTPKATLEEIQKAKIDELCPKCGRKLWIGPVVRKDGKRSRGYVCLNPAFKPDAHFEVSDIDIALAEFRQKLKEQVQAEINRLDKIIVPVDSEEYEQWSGMQIGYYAERETWKKALAIIEASLGEEIEK